jgi:lipid-A-disaccharide synthase
MRVFFSTGEASGELAAVDLARAMRAHDPDLTCEGIGNERMRAAGFTVRWSTQGWASMGPIDALGKIPKLLSIMFVTAFELKANPPDLLVLIDFGAFNVRLASTLRRIGYRGRILYYFPPAAWLDNTKRARQVARLCTPLTPFMHQRDFYRSLGLPIAYFGHPLVATIEPRLPRSPAPADGGTVAILPGSRRSEIARHTAPLFAAARELRRTRPQLKIVLGAADGEVEQSLRAALGDFPDLDATIVRGARPALLVADVAAIASGTAVLEAALLDVPTIALYVLSNAQYKIALRVYSGRWITIPNLVLKTDVVPEFIQAAATPAALAAALESLLADARTQHAQFAALRAELGDSATLDRCAVYALGLAAS